MANSQRVSPALKIALIYLAVAVLWILLSDRLVEATFPDGDAASWTQTVKGLGFVFVSAGVLYLLTHRYLVRAERTAEQLRQAYDETLEGWAAALDIRDRSTGEHTARVTDLTVALAARFGIEGARLDEIRRGATLHDIGKMAIPDAVLGKVEPLDDRDWELIRQHPDTAVRMLRGIEFLEPSLAIPWCHHEKWDGSGYPRGLVGEEIPFPARLFTVVDVYDALTSERPYREPLTTTGALERIEEEAGTHFDPVVAAEFVLMMRERQAAGRLDQGGRL